MPTYLLSWKLEGWQWVDLAEYVSQTREGKMPALEWSTGNTKSIVQGDRLFLFRHTVDRGIVASGYAGGASYVGPHWDPNRAGDTQNKIKVRWDAVLEPQDVLLVDNLRQADLGVHWDSIRGPGQQVSEASVARLEMLWQEHLLRVRSPGEELSATGDAVTTAGVIENDYAIENRIAEVKQRVRQSLFRRRVLENFGGRCCVSGLAESDLLIASHIVPWAAKVESRLDPANGLCLSVHFDALFDAGYFTVTDDLRVVVTTVRGFSEPLFTALTAIDGKQLRGPAIPLNPSYLAYHRDQVFRR